MSILRLDIECPSIGVNVALMSQLVIRRRREHLLNKEVILHENLLRLLELWVEVRDLNFRLLLLLPSLRLAFTIVVSSLVPIALLLLLGVSLLLIIYLVYIGVS